MTQSLNTSSTANVRAAISKTRATSRRRGSVVIYFALGMTAFIGIAALVLDLGFRYMRKAEAQRAADAAALAGVFYLSNPTYANTIAKYYAAKNGYNTTAGQAGYDPTTIVTMQTAPDGNQSHFRVQVSRIEPTFFGGMLQKGRPRVGASAMAEYISKAELNINGGGAYGVNGPVTLSLFGPDSYYNYGDPFSTKLLGNGSPNPQNKGWNGYDFAFEIPSNYNAQFGTNTATLDIFDPDCYNANNEVNATGIKADNTGTVDEYRAPTGGNGSVSNATTTEYSLYWDPNTPNDVTDDQQINTTLSIGADSAYDMKWNKMFQWNQSTYTGQTGRYRLNVKSTNGSSENGFNLRAGPPHVTSMNTATNTTWASTYGNKSATPIITATGNLPMNFNTAGTSTVTLGVVPGGAAGGELYINKFDTDVDAKSITYSCTTLPGQTFSGVLSNDGQWKMDTITLPANYTTGVWSATYKAGQGDTSVWQMSYQNYVPGQPGRLRLIE